MYGTREAATNWEDHYSDWLLSQGFRRGKATVCIFPDLNAANNGYKAVQQATKTVANGPIMQGLRLPVNDLSRGATVEDIVQTSAATALQAQDAKRKEMENQWA